MANTHLSCAAIILLLLISGFACGDYPGMYEGETLTFESPISTKRDNSKDAKEEIDDEDHSSDPH